MIASQFGSSQKKFLSSFFIKFIFIHDVEKNLKLAVLWIKDAIDHKLDSVFKAEGVKGSVI